MYVCNMLFSFTKIIFNNTVSNLFWNSNVHIQSKLKIFNDNITKFIFRKKSNFNNHNKEF